MARQKGSLRFVGTWGNTTGFKCSLAKKTGSNFVRVKTEEVSNPKTYNQARQRAKVRPASMFYNAFISILNHAFIPAGKEAKNRLRFMSLAMKNSTPEVMRSENMLPVKVGYQVSEGSLGLSSLCKGSAIAAAGNEGSLNFANVGCPTAWAEDAADVLALTVGQFSQALISANPQLSDGQELTFMGVLAKVSEPSERIAVHFSVVLDSNDTLSTMQSVFGSSNMQLAGYQAAGSTTASLVLVSTIGTYRLAAGAMIVSSRTKTSWIYTNSFLALTKYGDSLPFNEEAVIYSYMTAESQLESDRILQQADNTPQQGVQPRSGSNVAYTVSPAVAGATYNHATAAVVEMSDGSRRVVTSSNGVLLYWDGTGFEPIQQTLDGAVTSVFQSDTTWAGVRSITEQEAAGVPFS